MWRHDIPSNNSKFVREKKEWSEKKKDQIIIISRSPIFLDTSLKIFQWIDFIKQSVHCIFFSTQNEINQTRLTYANSWIFHSFVFLSLLFFFPHLTLQRFHPSPSPPFAHGHSAANRNPWPGKMIKIEGNGGRGRQLNETSRITCTVEHRYPANLARPLLRLVRN